MLSVNIGGAGRQAASGRIIAYSILGWSFAVPAALFAAVLARKLHLSHLSSAWITFGFFGLAGGAGFVLPIRSAGGRATAVHAVILSGVWTPCLVASVVPMFFTMGIPAKMALMALYFFSVFGAIGGLGTSWLLNAVFFSAQKRDPIAPAACWGFGFGLAALCGGLVGTLLSKGAPGFGAWVAGFLAMTAVAGVAGGCALLLFLRQKPDDSPLGGDVRRIDGSAAGLILCTLLLLLPFYANDLADIYLKDWRAWLAIDYVAVKLFPLLILAWLVRSGRIAPASLGLEKIRPLSFAAVFYAAVLSGTFIDQNAILLVGRLPGYTRLGEMPSITNSFFARLDLTFGLMMVALCEELVFRGYLLALLHRFTHSPVIIVGLSAAAFGLIHWSGGMHRVASTALVGAIFMMLYIRCRSLHPLILAHFLVNFLDFSGLFPASWFRFL